MELNFLRPDEDHAAPLTPTPTFYLLSDPDEPAGEGAPAPAVVKRGSCFRRVVLDPRCFVVLGAGEEASGRRGGGDGHDDDSFGRCCGQSGSGRISVIGHGAAVQAATAVAAAVKSGGGERGRCEYCNATTAYTCVCRQGKGTDEHAIAPTS